MISHPPGRSIRPSPHSKINAAGRSLRRQRGQARHPAPQGKSGVGLGDTLDAAPRSGLARSDRDLLAGSRRTGDVDGLILDDGTEIHLPPHLGAQVPVF